MGLEPNKVTEEGLGKLFGGTQDLGARILAARKLVVDSAGVVAAASKRYAESESDVDAAAFASAITRHDMIQSALAGVTAEWGRAGSAFHSLLGGWGDAEQLNQVLKQETGRDLFQVKRLAKLMATMDAPEQVSKLVQDSRKPMFGRMLLEYWINGLISGPSTHATYAVGNTLLALEKAGPETAAAAAVGRVRSALGREGEVVRLGEVGAQLSGAVRAIPVLSKIYLIFDAFEVTGESCQKFY